MKFPNAAKGIGKIFAAEIIQLITVLTGGTAAVLGFVFADSIKADTGSANDVIAITLLCLAVAAVVLAVISFIMMIIGVIQAARDESFFRGVIWLTLINIAVSVTAGFFSNNWFWNNLANTVSGFFGFLTTIFVILGVSRMALVLRDQDVIDTSGSLLKTIIGIGLVSLTARFFAIFLPLHVGKFILIGLACLGVVLEVVSYVLYLVMLSKAKKMLRNN